MASTYYSANPPFDDENADIILRSSDGVYFRLHKLILSKGIPSFGVIFAQLTDKGSQDEEPPTINMAEDSRTLEALLALFYPGVARPVFKSFDDLCPVLIAARKYDMLAVMTELGDNVNDLLIDGGDPLRAYALACLSQRPDVASIAASVLLDAGGQPALESPALTYPEFSVLPCDYIFALAMYRNACVHAAQAVVRAADKPPPEDGSSPWSPRGAWRPRSAGTPQPDWFVCRTCPPDDVWSISAGSSRPVGAQPPTQTWLRAYVRRLQEVLARRPSAAAAVDARVIDAAVDEAARCAACGRRARRHLAEFGRLLAERIEEAVVEVVLHLPL